MNQFNPTGPQILVVGLARSGTTWLAKMLDSHPTTLYRHESDYPPAFPRMPFIVAPDRTNLYQAGLQSFAHSLRGLNRVRQTGPLPFFPKNGERLFNHYGRTAVTLATKMAGSRLGNIRVPELFQPPDSDRLRILWKSVWSMGRVGVIAQALRPINILLILRHPCGVIASRRKGVEEGRMAPVSGAEMQELITCRSALAERLLGKINQSDPVEYEAFRWAVLNSKAIGELRNVPGCRVILYEDLCADPQAVMHDVMLLIGLSWDPQVEHFIHRSTSVTSSRYYGLYRRPERLDQWRATTSRAIQDRILEIVRESEAGQFYLGG